MTEKHELDYSSYPHLTNLPVWEDENGNWFGYGHIPRGDFIGAVSLIAYEHTEDDWYTSEDGLMKYADHVGYDYARLHEGGESFELCTPDYEDSFPITKFNL